MKIYIGKSDEILNKFDNDISCFHVKQFHDDSRAAFVLLKHIIEVEEYKTDFYVNYTEYKKPYIKGIYYNISHSKGMIAIAIGDSEVGVDIQKYTKVIDNTKTKYYHSDDFDQNLLHMWVIKESYLKYLGIGLRNDLYNVRINRNSVKYPEFENAYYKVFDLDNDYALAICMEKEENIEIIYI